MIETVLTPMAFPPRAPMSPGGAAPDVITDLCATLFESLPRSDQRRRAEQYVSGLMSAGGRKSMRHIAELAGDAAAEQNLHHFVSKSTWDHLPVRRALATHVARTNPPRAWVIQSLAIPKAGPHTVGVDRRFVREMGRRMNVQQAYGLWFAGEHASAPVNWQLVLPTAWVDDGVRRRRGEIPDWATAETPEQSVISVAAAVRRWPLEPRPVVLDARTVGSHRLVGGFASAGLPMLARVPGDARFALADRAMSGPLPAQQILEAARSLRRPVEWYDPVTGVPQVSAVAGLPVTAPHGSNPLLLMGEWRAPAGPPAQFWLTDLVATPPAALLRLTRLTRRVEHDFETVGERVGLRDFAGRTYHGWHRHMTMASVAYTARRLTLGR